MPQTGKLKVYRTPIGFHDAYVAASSQKAALKAWGADANLFARGIAEVVTDAAFTKEPLAAPGNVIRRLRGTTAEQLAALPKAKPRSQTKRPASSRTPRGRTKRPPSRRSLEAAERALSDALARQKTEIAELRREALAIKERRNRLERDHSSEAERLRADVDRAETEYHSAVNAYDG